MDLETSRLKKIGSRTSRGVGKPRRPHGIRNCHTGSPSEKGKGFEKGRNSRNPRPRHGCWARKNPLGRHVKNGLCSHRRRCSRRKGSESQGHRQRRGEGDRLARFHNGTTHQGNSWERQPKVKEGNRREQGVSLKKSEKRLESKPEHGRKSLELRATAGKKKSKRLRRKVRRREKKEESG